MRVIIMCCTYLTIMIMFCLQEALPFSSLLENVMSSRSRPLLLKQLPSIIYDGNTEMKWVSYNLATIFW